MERATAHLRIAIDEKRRKRALRERPLLAVLVQHGAEFHIDIRELREGLVMSMDRARAQRQQPLLGFAEGVRTHPADFLQRKHPRLEQRIGEHLCKGRIFDALNLRRDECAHFTDLGQKVLQLAFALQILRVGAVFAGFEARVVMEPLDGQAQFFFAFQAVEKRLRRCADPALKLRQLPVSVLQGGKILLPFRGSGVEHGEIPGVGGQHLLARRNLPRGRRLIGKRLVHCCQFYGRRRSVGKSKNKKSLSMHPEVS